MTIYQLIRLTLYTDLNSITDNLAVTSIRFLRTYVWHSVAAKMLWNSQTLSCAYSSDFVPPGPLVCLYVPGIPTSGPNLKENIHKQLNKSSGAPDHQWCSTPSRCQMLWSHACYSLSLSLFLFPSLAPSLCTLDHQWGDGSSSSCISVPQDHLPLSSRSRSVTNENRPTGGFCTHTYV